MSAVALLYPTKPSEVSDDMESFIYIILYMAFRFHRHSWTRSGVKKSDPEKKRRYENSKNEAFARVIDSIFYEDNGETQGYYTGGITKKDKINNGEPPIKLLRNRKNDESLLDLFLRNAYRMLWTHYKAIDWERLKSYEVALPVNLDAPESPSRSSEQEESSTSQRYDPFADSRPGIRNSVRQTFAAGQDDLFANNISDHLPMVSGEYASLALPVKPVRLLDNHDAMQRLFEFVFVDRSGELRHLPSLRDEKIWDQFDGLMVVVSKDISSSSGEKKRYLLSSSSSDNTPSQPI